MGFAHAPRDDRGVGQRHTRGLRGESADLSEPAAAAKDENQPRHVLEITWTSKYVELLSHTVRHQWTPGVAPLPRARRRARPDGRALRARCWRCSVVEVD